MINKGRSRDDRGERDDYQTPPEGLTALFYILPNSWTIWEPAAGDGIMANALEQKGYTVIRSDIHKGFDFLKNDPVWDFDVIVTNPPYSKKFEFLKRACVLNKPFALLLPYTTRETVKRQDLFIVYDLKELTPKKRINFIPPIGIKNSSVNFPTEWVTRGLLDRAVDYELRFEREAQQHLLRAEAIESV